MGAEGKDLRKEYYERIVGGDINDYYEGV